MTWLSILVALVSFIGAPSSSVAWIKPAPGKCIFPATKNACPPEQKILQAISPGTDNDGICFDTSGHGEKRIRLNFHNVLSHGRMKLEKLAIAPNGNRCSVTRKNVKFNVVIPPHSGDCKVKVGVYGFSAAYRRAAPASVTATKCTFNSFEKCLMCPNDDLEVSLPNTVCLRPMTVADTELRKKVGGLRNTRLDKLLKENAQEICKEGVFQPVSDPCEELNAHWRTLGTSLFPAGATIPAVTQSTTPAEIKHFISNLPTPAGTKAVGVFSGACGLADNPHKNLALVVNYCGVSKASQPTVAADADPAPRTAAAAAAPEVDFSAAFNAALGF